MGQKVRQAAREESHAARLANEGPGELKMDSLGTAQADMAWQHERDERGRMMKEYQIKEKNAEYMYGRKREIADRQWKVQQQVEAAQERARKASEHRRSLGVRALKGLYVQAWTGDQLVQVMFALKQAFGVHKAGMRIGGGVLKAWALHDMKAAVVSWQGLLSKNKSYLASRKERETSGRRRTRAYGDELFKNHPVLEAVFPVCRSPPFSSE